MGAGKPTDPSAHARRCVVTICSRAFGRGYLALREQWRFTSCPLRGQWHVLDDIQWHWLQRSARIAQQDSYISRSNHIPDRPRWSTIVLHRLSDSERTRRWIYHRLRNGPAQARLRGRRPLCSAQIWKVIQRSASSGRLSLLAYTVCGRVVSDMCRTRISGPPLYYMYGSPDEDIQGKQCIGGHRLAQ